jgi:hypothetical protein
MLASNKRSEVEGMAKNDLRLQIEIVLGNLECFHDIKFDNDAFKTAVDQLIDIFKEGLQESSNRVYYGESFRMSSRNNVKVVDRRIE